MNSIELRKSDNLRKVPKNPPILLHRVEGNRMKIHLIMNGLDPKKELERHDKLAADYRDAMKGMGRRRNWRYRDLMNSAIFHEEEATKLRREGVGA
jgi:hypothetical protein